MSVATQSGRKTVSADAASPRMDPLRNQFITATNVTTLNLNSVRLLET